MPLDEIEFEAEEKMEKTVEVLAEEFRRIRSGRADAGLVEHIKVDYYGAETPLNQMATIAVPEPQLIVIRPYEPGMAGEVVKALQEADLGLNPTTDGKLVRLAVPPPSQEHREQLASQVKKLAEEARVALRNVRHKANKEIETEEKEHQLSEDDAYRGKDEILELLHKYEEKVNELLEKKTKEIMEV
ncbi:MAG: ribosome recycling factor [Planctomycetes bacterium DG_23]|nr:MAG: ribosome recycling factor [Planctomycetes bacterium DG_23]